jgi:hypothetical protein
LGKKAHGRLVHEIRQSLLRHGFYPTRITQLEAQKGVRELRLPGFKVEKHNDGKSVRLFHVPPDFVAEARSRHLTRPAGRVRRDGLVEYGVPLEREGFTCIAVNSHGPSGPHSLWRRGRAQPDGR